MKNICQKIILIPLFLLFFDGFAQQIPAIDSISFYGSFSTHLAFYESNCEVQNNGSRVGLFMNQKLKNGLVFFGKTEWAVNTVENNYTFNQGAVTAENVSEGLFVPSKNAFDTRLGFFGVSFKKFGTLTLGKQWSAYYDVSGWTDMFNVFGGQGSGTYLSGTDGGGTGLGRASKALIYRNNFGPVKLALQTQLTGDVANYGGSLILQITKQLKFGFAIYNSRVDEETQSVISGSKPDNLSSITGLQFRNNKLFLGLNYNIQGLDILQITNPDTALINGYAANGLEFFGKYLPTEKIAIIGGFNFQNPKSSYTYIADNFQLKYLVIGSEYYFTPKAIVYIECKFDDSIDYLGNSEFNVYTLGFRFDFNVHTKEKI
jgi:predicted porin